MKVVRWGWLVLCAAAVLVCGCDQFWDAPSSSDTTGTTTLTSGKFYVINAETDQIAGYYVDAGTLTALSGSPYTMSAAPIALTIAPNNNFLYVSTANGIYVYSIASTGKLTIANSGSPISSDVAASMQVDSTGQWLLDTVNGVAGLNAIAISSTTGLLTSTTEQVVTLPASTLYQLTLSPNNEYVFVAMGAGGTARIPFTASNTDPLGAVTTTATVSSSGAAIAVAVDPSDRLLYIGETAATSGSNTGGIRAIDLSTMSEISGSPFTTEGLAPYSILPEATGTYVYVANRQSASSSKGNIAGFTVAASGSTYTLTALSSTFSTGTHPISLVEDNSDQFVFAANFGGSSDLTGYVFDTTTAGDLDKVISSSTGTDPVEATAVAALH